MNRIEFDNALELDYVAVGSGLGGLTSDPLSMIAPGMLDPIPLIVDFFDTDKKFDL